MTTDSPLTFKPDDSPDVSHEVAYVGTHPEIVLDWRQEQFRRMGFAPHVADNLAAGKVDLHMMEDLLASGASLDLALRILSGTAWFGDDAGTYMPDASEAVLEDPVAS